MSKKRKKSNVITLAEIWTKDKDGNPIKIKFRGHVRSIKKRVRLAELETTMLEKTNEVPAP